MKNNNQNTKQLNENHCEQTELLIDDYLEGMISLKDKEMVDEHISKCPQCSNYLKETSKLIGSLNSLPEDHANISIQKKDELWNKIESKVSKENNAAVDDLKSVVKKDDSFILKYKYILTGIAAVLVIAFIVYAVKNINFKDVQLPQQSAFGLPTYWKVASVSGTPMIGDVAMQGTDSIKEGQWIQTNDSSRAELLIATIGNVIIEPNSKVIFIKGEDGNNRIAVEYGTIAANMNSAPKTFFVEMPSAVAMDLGGEYKLTIDSAGDGLVYVKSGKVEIQSPNREAIVPAGNLVITKKDVGVGTPFNEKSSAAFKNALLNLDFGSCGETCVNTILNTAKMSDAITLVNLIPKVEEQYKDEVYNKVANFVSPPVYINSDSIPFIDEEKLNKWVDKIQAEIEKNVEESVRNMEKSIEKMNEIENFHFDTLKWMENFNKNFKVKIPKAPKTAKEYHWNSDTTYFDKEQFEKDMENLQRELKENANFDKEELKKNMEELKENLEDMKEDLKENLHFNNEELKRELEKAKEEIKNSLKDMDKVKIEMDKIHDTSKIKYKVKINDKDGDEEIEVPEAPEIPETEPPQK